MLYERNITEFSINFNTNLIVPIEDLVLET